jgi:hypothetical protein
MEVETGELIRNTLQSRVYLRTLAKIYSQVDLAIQDRV